jgi:hypothetical protein
MTCAELDRPRRGRPPKDLARVGLEAHILSGGTVKEWAFRHGVSTSIVGKWLQLAGVHKQWLSQSEWEHISKRRMKYHEKRHLDYAG